ncbi:MAG: AAA domain-containing protein [Ignavibacteriales bacterium]|nr:AAA domain-containing protein [Ignavibacteriales bacterium]
MSSPTNGSTNTSPFLVLAQALRAEREKLTATRTEISLFSGEFLGSFAGYFYYRFEVPEDLYLHNVDRVLFTFSQLQPVTLEGKIISLANQFVVVALPMDFGAVLPEIKCRWNYDELLPHVIETLASADKSHIVASLLLQPDRPENVQPVSLDPAVRHDTTPDQLDALKRIAQNRVSYLWGPTRTGKTQTLALVAISFLRAGKSVLLLAPNAGKADQLLSRTVAIGKELGVELFGLATRVGLPLVENSAGLGLFSLEEEVELKRSDKKKQLEERVGLLRTYWRTKVHQYLHDDFYARLNDLRDRANDIKKQLEKVRDEITGLKDTITRAQNASMIERLKTGFSKEAVAAAQKQLTEKQALQKKLQPAQQALTTELMRAESQTPIDSAELKEYQAAVKRIGELGGLRKVTEDVEQLSAVDENTMLSSKRCMATTVTNFFCDPRLRGRRYDLVLVDDAEQIHPPYLAAASLCANEAMVVAGDPLQPGPESYSKGDLAQTWLQRDPFLIVAPPGQLHQLPDWARQNPRWPIRLSSHFTTTPKLSRFMASVFFDDKIDVLDQPRAKGNIFVVDTSDLKSTCRQYLGKKSLLPYNDLQTKRTIELAKHICFRSQKHASEVGIIVPFQGTTLFTKLQLRLQGIRHVEVGTPQMFQGRRKKVIIFDATMAGVDYTMRQLDDKKTGEHRIARLLNAIFSSVEEDLYVVADFSHFTSVYRDRLLTKILLLLRAQADSLPPFAATAKQFDDLDWDSRERFLSLQHAGGGSADKLAHPAGKIGGGDADLELRMKLIARQPSQQPSGARNFEQETYFSVHRVLGMREDVNLLSQFVGGDLLFRHTLATEQAAARLPIDGCTNEEEFRKIMERWNLLIYEMSGAGKTDLSFFAKQTPEARVRWDIFSLRAYYSSAMEAVVEESKHRIATSVSKVFQECLGKSQPANPGDWSTAYLNFLGKMEAYLEWISEQLRR